MVTKAFAFVLELSALAAFIGAFAADPIRWDLVGGALVLFAVGLAIHKRFGHF